MGFFQQGGDSYAAYRPSYPESLAASLAALAPETSCALDVGCGNGQLTTLLAPYFESVIGVDPSVSQLGAAANAPNVTYLQQSADALDFPEASFDLIVAAQAAHWFDLNAFYANAKRVAKPDAVLAFVSYGVPTISAAVNTTFQRGYWCDLHEFWSPERLHVECGYESLAFPFARKEAPAAPLQKSLTLEQLIGYITTWSAYESAKNRGEEARFENFFDQLGQDWGDQPSLTMTWPLSVRAGFVNTEGS